MDRNKYRNSKIPASLALLFALNIFLVIALEILLLYPHPAELTEEYLAGYDAGYQNCTIITSQETGTLRCYLVKTESGAYSMIPTQHHGLFTGKAKIYEKQITTVSPDAAETEITVKTGVHSSLVTVRQEPLEGYGTETFERYLYILYHASGNMSGTMTLYMVIAAILEGLELAIWHLVRQQ